MGIFFFQAEDGIRDLVRSRGLGDVYKRQVPGISAIKRAKNKTKDIADANGTKASGGDIIEYLSLIHI